MESMVRVASQRTTEKAAVNFHGHAAKVESEMVGLTTDFEMCQPGREPFPEYLEKTPDRKGLPIGELTC
jgi:hypothetical protein